MYFITITGCRIMSSKLIRYIDRIMIGNEDEYDETNYDRTRIPGTN